MDLYYYLRELLDIQLAALNDPTGLGSRFTAYSSEGNRLDALSKLDTAVSRARKANDYYLASKHDEAIAQWKLVFDQ